jgi:hypothetical protein
MESSRPSEPAGLLDELAELFVPGPLLGLEAFGPVQDQSVPQQPEEPVSEVGSPLLLEGAVQDEPVLQDDSAALGAEEEEVDEEIVIDTPPVHVGRDMGTSSTPTRGALSVSRFATPPVVFHRARPAIPTRPQVAPARPRTLGEFLAAARSCSDALMQSPAVRRRLLALNFQPHRSSRIAGQPGGMNMEMKAVRNLMRKLGLLSGDEASSEAALEAYHKMFELPMTDDMIEAIAELYGWSLATIRGCSPPLLGLSGGRLVEA